MRISFKVLPLLILMAAMSGCASLSSYVEAPAVSVVGLEVIPGPGRSAPTLRVELEVSNPNRVALPLAGMTYSMSVNDQRLLSGSTGDLPTIPAFGRARFDVDMTPDLLGGLRLINQLAQAGSSQPLAVHLDARLELGGLRPALRVSEVIELQGR